MSTSKSLSIVVLAERIREQKLLEVLAACSRLGVVPTLCSRDELPYLQGDVLIASVGAGDYRIPDECLDFAARSGREVSLLLLSEQALTRPTVSLSDGRVSLLSPKQTADGIYSRLCVARAERTPPDGAFSEYVNVEFWTRAWHSGDAPHCVRLVEGGSLSWCFDETGKLEFSAETREWSVFWPDWAGTLWLLSPLRVPAVFDVSRWHGGKGNARLRAESGDLMVAFSRNVESGRALGIVDGLLPQLESGGPHLFESVRDRLASVGDCWACIVELR